MENTMKKLANRLVFGRDIGITLLAVVAIIFTAAFACESGGDKVPPDDELQSLVKNTTAELASAVDTEDFSKLYANASEDLRRTYSLSQIKDAYKVYIDNKSDYLGSLKSAGSSTPKFSPAAGIRTENGLNILVASGDFASTPHPVHFDYEYVWRDGGWKVLKLFLKV
jgi:hypothetical protein